MALAPAFQRDHELPHRIRVIAFAVLTPFYFLKAGSLVEAKALISGAALIALFLVLKMATKFIGILPLTRYYRFGNRDGMYSYFSAVPQSSAFAFRALGGPGDASNSQYGLLGVWSGAEVGVEVPVRYWKDVEKHWTSYQLRSGEWGYKEADRTTVG